MGSESKKGWAKEVGVTISIYFVSYFLCYIANILISQLFGVQQYSDYAVASAFLTVTSAFALLGFDKATLHYLPRYFSYQKFDLAAYYVRSSFWTVLLFSLGVAIVSGIFIVFFEFKRDESLQKILLMSLFVLPIITSVDYLSKLMISKKHIISSLIAFKVQQPLILMVLVMVCYVAHGRSSALLIGCLALTWLLVLGLFLFWLRSDLPHYAKARHSMVCWRAWLGRAFPFWISNIVLVTIQNMGVLVLEMLNASAKEVAIFAAVSQTCQFLTMVYTAINLIALPRFSEISTHNMSQLQSVLNDYLKVVFYFCSLFIIVVLLFGHQILGLFGPEFTKGYSTLCVLTIGAIVNVYCGLSTSVLQVEGLRRHVLKNAVSLLCLTMIGMFLLTPYFGMLGAAWGFTLGMTIVNVQQLVFVKKRWGLSFFNIFSDQPLFLQGKRIFIK